MMTTKTGRTRPWSWLAIYAMLTKIPMIAMSIAMPAGIAGIMPPVILGPAFFLVVGFLLSGIIFLLLRSWFGGVSVFAYALYTLIGAPFQLGGYPIWLIAVMATSAAAIIGVIGAFARREISFTHISKGTPHD